MIRDSGDNCEVRKNVFLEVIDFDNSFDYTIDTLECGDSVRLQLIPIPSYDLSLVDLVWEVKNEKEVIIFTEERPVFIINNTNDFKISGRVSDNFGCSKTVVKNVQFDFVQEEIIDALSICRGDAIALNPNFNPNHQYLWSPAALFDNPTVPNPIISPRNSTIVNVSISNQTAACAIQRSIDLTVLNSIEEADFTFQINGCTDSIILEITEIIVPDLGSIETANWQLNSSLATRTSDELLPIFVLQNSQSVELTLTLNGNDACPKTITKTVQLNLLEALNLLKRVDICQGENIALNPAEAFPEYMYNWTPADAFTNPTAINPIITPNQSTVFQLSYTDSTQLCTITQDINLKVRDTLPPISADFTVACDARTLQINPNAAVKIAYDFGDNQQLMDSSSSVTHVYESEGIYEVRLRYIAENICADSTSFEIDLPIDNLVPDFAWNVESCTNNIAALELLDVSKTAFGTITNWDWTLSTGATSTEREPLFQITTNEVLSALLVVTLDNETTCQDSIQMEIPPLLIEETITDSIIDCLGSSISLNPDFNESYSYAWSPKTGLDNANSPNPSLQISNAQQFQVQITNEFDCLIMDSIFIAPAPTIEIEFLEVPVVCDTMEVVLFAESEQTDQLVWQAENGDTLGIEPELLVNIDHSQTFSVTFTDRYNCENEANIFVDFQPVLLEYAATQAVCQDESKVLMITNLDLTNDLKVDWMPQLDIISGGETLTPEVELEEPTTFSFMVSNEAGCQTTGEIFVDILPLPELTATSEPANIFQGETSQLSATSSPTYLYDWSPTNSLDNPTISNPIVSPIITTIYVVTVTDENGCQNTADITVNLKESICDFPYIFVPSGFTPNGDGENDALFVRGDFIDELSFMVFDRWGDKVFETTNQTIGWDGAKNGQDLPPGVFGYYLNATCKNGETYQRQGNVTLIR